jgi:RsiW-degrading membrane proteinase PrsW (M82 family)
MKRIHHSKTMWFSLALVIFGALYDNFSNLQNLISDKYYGLILVIIGIVVAILRYKTSEEIQ